MRSIGKDEDCAGGDPMMDMVVEVFLDVEVELLLFFLEGELLLLSSLSFDGWDWRIRGRESYKDWSFRKLDSSRLIGNGVLISQSEMQLGRPVNSAKSRSMEYNDHQSLTRTSLSASQRSFASLRT